MSNNFRKKNAFVSEIYLDDKGRSPYNGRLSEFKYLFTGSLKIRSIDNLETQKKYISMKNSQFFNYLFYAKSK